MNLNAVSFNKKTKAFSKKIEIEKQIASHLKNGLSKQKIFKKIYKNNLNEDVSLFLYLSGQYKTLLEYSARHVENQKKAPWAFILSLFVNQKIKVQKEHSKMLFQVWLEKYSKQEPHVFACKDWAKQSSEFKALSTIYINNLRQMSVSPEEELLDKLEFVKSQGLMQEEENIIKLLLGKKPSHPAYLELKKDLLGRQAIQFMQDKKALQHKRQIQDVKFIPEKSPLKKKWSFIVDKYSDKQVSQTKNLSLFLVFLGWPDEAVKIMKKNIQDLSDYWLYLEWLIETRQYATGLEITNQLLNQLNNDPSSLLPLNYIKAQSLYHLGKKNEAINYIKAIIEVNPRYKNAQFLLEKWTS